MNAGTATIYRHALDRAMDEATGELGRTEPFAPATRRFSIEVARVGSGLFFAAATPHPRKIALRSAMTMRPGTGGIFDTLLGLVRACVARAAASGEQFVSWIHYPDFIRAIEYAIGH